MKIVIEIPDDMVDHLIENVAALDNYDSVSKESQSKTEFLQERLQLWVKNYLEARPRAVDVSSVKVSMG